MKSQEATLEGVDGDGKSRIADDESWIPSDFVHEPPLLNVTQPNGSFCQIEAKFSVPLSPDEVYDIITDPNNRNVFKNIKEVLYRKILQDDGNRQVVEVEQLGRWRFLMISGTFSSRVIVEQNRQEHTMFFDLARKGMMKKFSGSWKIEPIVIMEKDATTESLGLEDSNKDSENSERGSWVNFNQTVEPTFIPPWPLNRYVRAVTAKIVREICGDLQKECIRLAEMNKPTGTKLNEINV